MFYLGIIIEITPFLRVGVARRHKPGVLLARPVLWGTHHSVKFQQVPPQLLPGRPPRPHSQLSHLHLRRLSRLLYIRSVSYIII